VLQKIEVNAKEGVEREKVFSSFKGDWNENKFMPTHDTPLLSHSLCVHKMQSNLSQFSRSRFCTSERDFI
jgi:hypothetical protein